MADDAWKVGSSASTHRPSQETRPAHETKLLHELIIQAVTERRVDVTPNLPYDKQLETTIKSIQSRDGYKALLAKHSANPADVSALLDHQHLQRLPTIESSQHVTLMMATGGPATGKSSIIQSIQQMYPTTYRDAAKINPDDYKPLLASPEKYGKAYADVSHAESSKLAADIMVRLEEKMAVGRAPHIVMDVVATSEHRMNFAKQAGQLVVITGTAPLEVTVPRAYDRGLPEDGRRIPTRVVIEGARNVALELPRIFEHPNVTFVMRDTNVDLGQPSKPVAAWSGESRTIKISNPDTFIDLVERRNVNVDARSAAQLFSPHARTPEAIAQGLKAYTDKGITLAFLDARGELAMSVSREGVERIGSLPSHRGDKFFEALAGAATQLLGRHPVDSQRRAQVEEIASTEPNAQQGKRGAPQTPLPILLPTAPPSERGVSQNPIPIIVSQGEHAQTPPPVVVIKSASSTLPEVPPQRTSLPSKVGIAGAAAQLAIGPVFEATLSAANDGKASDVAAAGLHGLTNAALPGVTSEDRKNKHCFRPIQARLSA